MRATTGRRGTIIVSLLLFGMAAALAACTTDPPLLQFTRTTGTEQFVPTTGPHPGAAITVWYHQGTDVAVDPRERPILIVMHGSSRNADDYRDSWIDEADRHGALLVVPEFDDRYSSREYNQGNLKADEPDRRTFAVIEELFQWVRTEVGSSADGYHLYGHSAGGQFVHRFMMYQQDHHVTRAVAANAGWYTTPDPEVGFPYGLADGPDIDMAQAFRQPLIIALGTADDESETSNMRTTDQAMAQGRARFERGHFFFEVAEKQAAEVGAELAWQLKTVIAAEHSNDQMAPSAARFLFESE